MSSAGKQTMIQERHLPGKGEREGQHKLFAIVTIITTGGGLSLHQGAKETGQRGRVSSLIVLVDVGSHIQMLVSPPTFDV